MSFGRCLIAAAAAAAAAAQASRLRRGQASTVRLFVVRHGNFCQSLSCSGPKSEGKHALVRVSNRAYLLPEVRVVDYRSRQELCST